LREEGRLRVLENGTQRKIFGSKMKVVIVDWRILHNEEFSDLHSSPNIIRLDKRM
jgi:hypothetical protein